MLNVLKPVLREWVRGGLGAVHGTAAKWRYRLSGHDPQKAAEAEKPLPQASSRSFCIFAAHQTGTPEANVIEFLKILGAKGFSVLLVNSAVLSPAARVEAQKFCWAYIERENWGRDFGSYQHGALLLKKYLGEQEPERVLFCNDSVFILPERLPEFIDDLLARREDWLGVFESQSPQPHVQSWFFSGSGKMWQHPAFQQFWRDYQPINARFYAIAKGEMGLSETLQKSGFRPFPILSGTHYMEQVRKQKSAIDPAKYFPRLFLSACGGDWLAYLEKIQAGANPTHLWQIWGVLEGTLPFIKKDLSYRQVFTRNQLRGFFTRLRARGLSDSLASQAEEAIFARTSENLRGLKKLLWRQGII